jgi:ferritin
MTPKVKQAMEKQADHEAFAAQAYLAMAYWCDVNHLSGFARFFLQQAEEEREHAGKILKHVADRAGIPVIGATAAPRTGFQTILDVAQAAYDLERANTAGIHATYETALAEKDYPAQVMLHWFIEEQVEEEAWSDKLLVKTREAGCAGALMNLDRHLTKELTKDVD